MKDAPASIQSWARLSIYEGAVEVVHLHSPDARRAALLQIPEKVRPYVEAEVKRIWPMRSEL